jgi:hypothetical protein
MPFEISRTHPKCKGQFAVVTKGTSKLHGCHSTLGKATKQLRALYANVPEARQGG